jgi:hypothetical protein
MEPMETIQASFDYSEWENPMGERCKDALRLDFNRKLKPGFHGTKVRGIKISVCAQVFNQAALKRGIIHSSRRSSQDY